MKSPNIPWTVPAIAGLLLLLMSFTNVQRPMTMPQDPDYPREWAAIDSLEEEGLIRSALDKVLELNARAQRDKRPAQVVKTLIYQAKYTAELEEDGEVVAIDLLRREMEKATFPQQAILQSMLGELYQGYLENNSWTIQDRTPISGDQPGDLRTWTAEQIQKESSRLYLEALKNPQLKQIALGDWKVLTTEARNTEGLWPTLYDMLAHRAIAHFADDRSFLTSPAYRFYLDKDEAFADAKYFALFLFETKDAASWEFQALRLYQEVLLHHVNTGNIPALLDADLKRLQFVRSHAVNDLKDSLFVAALERLEKQYPQQPGTAEVMHARASFYAERGQKFTLLSGEQYRLDKKQAKSICQDCIKRFPKSYGASLCANLIQTMQTPSVQIKVEEVLLPDKPALVQVAFANTPEVHLRLIRMGEEQRKAYEKQNYEDQIKYLASLPVLRQWKLKLPDDGDMQRHITEGKLDALPVGQYALLANDSLDFSDTRRRPGMAFFQVSNLAYLSRNRDNGEMEFVVMHRETGAPMEGVNVTYFENYYDPLSRSTKQREIGKAVTDRNGFVRADFPGTGFVIRLSKGADMLQSPDNYYTYRREDEERSWEFTTFFLDRAIYRPGQTIYYKGIAVRKDRDGKVHILANRKVTVTFYDVNQQEIAEQDLTTNAYGSFNGTFVAPQGGLRGEMSLKCSIGESWKQFRVEEYKRPRFEVVLQALKGEPQLNENVTLTGEAKAFAGSSVDGAIVNYRVVRQARFPWWPWWRGPMPWSSESMEIANGQTTTDAQGQFNITFRALPDRSVPRDSRPEFQFTVYADVVDITGETHSAERMVNIGYVGLHAEVEVPKQVDRARDQTIRIKTTNLDGQFQPARGTMRVYALQAPGQVFLERYWEKPDRPLLTEAAFRRDFPYLAFGTEDDPLKWARKDMKLDAAFNTAQADSVLLSAKGWEIGAYLLVMETSDSKGEVLEQRHVFTLYDSGTRQAGPGALAWSHLTDEVIEPGQSTRLLLGSGKDPVFALVEMERDEQIISSNWLELKGWNEVAYTAEETDRGNVLYHLSYVRYNRVFVKNYLIRVPWTNKQLKIEYQTFRDKLLPGQEEEWRIRISGPAGEKVAAEMLAAMYDASLDQFVANSWYFDLYPERTYGSRGWSSRLFGEANLMLYRYQPGEAIMEKTYPALNWYGFYVGGGSREIFMMANARSIEAETGAPKKMLKSQAPAMAAYDSAAPPPPPPPAPMENMEVAQAQAVSAGQPPSGPAVRRNLNETVFFFPELYTDPEGAVIVKFKMNEALTRWKFLALAHTRDLLTGVSTREVVTQKDLMVLPNAPRFMREGDVIEYTAKVSNLSDKTLQGTARLELINAETMQPVDDWFENTTTTVSFTVPAGQSAPLSWRLEVPAGKVSVLTHRVTVRAGDFSDGEESTLPVLTNRMLVTETLPLYVRGGKTKTFTLEAMKGADASSTLTPHQFSLEFTSNPAWLAVKALPYLMEFPHECSEQVFSRYYANALAGSVVNANPRIQKVFEKWKGTDALQSQLMKNQELKAVLLEETPWVIEAQSEAEQRKNIALLFDLNRMGQEQARAISKLAEQQLPSGAFPWFSGGPDNWYITQHILAGLGKLDYLKVKQPEDARNIMANALTYVDEKVAQSYQELKRLAEEGRIKLADDHLGGLMLHYLYTRSFLGKDEIPEATQEAFAYYLNQTKTYWTSRGVMEQGLAALALHRLGEPETAKRILASLRERALRSEELGMYWKFARGFYWQELPVETQALMIELFDEVGKNTEEVEELKIWLLKNKQTNRWNTTKATAEAVYALLRTGKGGEALLSQDKPVQISFPDIRKKKDNAEKLAQAQQDAEPGTGYFKTSWQGKAIQNTMATVQVSNPNQVISWGGAYWQYFEQLDKIKTFEETPLKLNKQLFRQDKSDTGPVLKAVDAGATLKPGDKLIVRLELRVDRDMEYVHLKDLRGSGLEPINVLSQYKWQGGLGYYESTGDAATHFFIDFLRKGTYVFEYPLRVVHKGNFSNGITSIQCMYAPEFSSHSAGVRVKVE